MDAYLQRLVASYKDVHQLVNLTRHQIDIQSLGGARLALAPSGIATRCLTRAVQVTTLSIDGHAIPIVIRYPDEPQDLPAPSPGTLFVTPKIVVDACPDRDDLIAPDAIIRNDAGVVVACHRFARPLFRS